MDLAPRLGHAALDAPQEGDELAVPMARLAAADDRALEHVERGEERGRAVTEVVVGLALGDARAQRQDRPGPVECLDLALLVDAQHQGFVRRAEVQAHDVAHFGNEVRVTAELEALQAVRLQVVLLPDAVHRRRADPLGLGHRAHAPLRSVARRGPKRGLHDRLDLARADPRLAPRAGGVLEQPRHSSLGVPLTPQQHRRPAHSQFLGEGVVGTTLGRPEHDARPQRNLLRGVAAAGERAQHQAIRCADRQRCRGIPGHARRLAR